MSLILEQLKSQLKDREDQLVCAYAAAKLANEEVDRVERETRALQAAIDIMEGKEPVIAPKFEALPITKILVKPGLNPEIASQQTIVNGEAVIVEPGFRVGKNSFGEDVLIPDSMPELTPMAEPEIPHIAPPLLPSIGLDEGFAADMPTLGGEF